MSRNVTISLPEDLAREARQLAAEKGLSLSRFVSQLLGEHVETTKRYCAARERHMRWLQQGLPLGTQGAIPWSREAPHER